MAEAGSAPISEAAAKPVIYIDPAAAPGGNGSIAHPYHNWDFGPLQAGTSYLQRAGTTASGVIEVAARSTAAAPLVIGSYGAGAAPLLDGAVDVDGASYAEVVGLGITNPTGAAVIVQQDSSHIEVAGNSISASAAGIWIGNGVGSHISIVGNTVTGSAGGGILVDGLPASSNPVIRIARNQVSGSGGDGIQIESNGIAVSGNLVSDNGLAMQGASGIQVYAASDTSGLGRNNLITGNVVTDDHDSTGQDGNGILLDQWTSGNVVSDNFATGNDGAGMGLYDSSGNTITGNVLADDAMDRGGSHRIHAEISLYDTVGLTRDNIFSGNTALSFVAGAVAAYVDPLSVTAGNLFSGDVLENAAGGDVFQAAGVASTDPSLWNAIMGASDRFSGVELSAPVAGERVNYRFAPHTVVSLDDHVVRLVGWSVSAGLLGT